MKRLQKKASSVSTPALSTIWCFVSLLSLGIAYHCTCLAGPCQSILEEQRQKKAYEDRHEKKCADMRKQAQRAHEGDIAKIQKNSKNHENDFEKLIL